MRTCRFIVSVNPASRAWPLREHLEVTFRDLDLAGHVNNSVVFTWMETLRLHHYLTISGLDDVRAIDFILAEAQARYHVPVRYDHRVIGEVAPSSVGRTSWELVYRFSDEATQTVLMRGRSVQVSYDYVRREKKPLPANVRECLLNQVVDAGDEGWHRFEGKA